MRGSVLRVEARVRGTAPRGRGVARGSLGRVALAATAAGVLGCGPEAPPAGGGAADSVRTGAAAPAPALERQTSGTGALLQAVSAVSARVVWVSGHDGTWARTLDGGATWEAAVVPGTALADGSVLQFRDVEAFDASTAYLMSAGSGPRSRIYRTDDGGATWALQYTAVHPDAFLDCLAFWDARRGLAYGDAVDEAPFVLRTGDGGARWTRVPAGTLPKALEGEGGFAASGTCLRAAPGGRAWIATGNGARARVLLTEDGGASWAAVDVPVVGGASAGLTTVDVGADGRGIALGGVIGGGAERTETVAVTADGGRSWSPGAPPAFSGPVYGAARVPGTEGGVVAVGPGGIAWSGDLARSWTRLDTLAHWAVGFAPDGTGWAVGPDGRITRIAGAGGPSVR